MSFYIYSFYRVSFPYNPDDVKTLWFDQRLDHFSPTDTTMWKQVFFVWEVDIFLNTQFYVIGIHIAFSVTQRYYWFDKFFVPNGPVFLMLGGEGEATANWFNNTQWVVWGQKYGALCIQLEHRYYGQSHPTPFVFLNYFFVYFTLSFKFSAFKLFLSFSDASTSNLRWLTSEQALADAASFVSEIVAEKHLESSKWVVYGGSYSGLQLFTSCVCKSTN